MSVRVVPDTAAAVIGVLGDALGSGVRVSGKRPATGDELPVVQVATDGGSTWTGFGARVLVRVSIYGAAREAAYDLAAEVHAVLLEHAGPTIARVDPAGFPIGDEDPSTGGWVETMTVYAVVQAV